MSDFLKELKKNARTVGDVEDLQQEYEVFKAKKIQEWVDQEIEQLKENIKKKSVRGEYTNINGERTILSTYNIGEIKHIWYKAKYWGYSSQTDDLFNKLIERGSESLIDFNCTYTQGAPLYHLTSSLSIVSGKGFFGFGKKRKVLMDVELSNNTVEFLKKFKEKAVAEGINIQGFCVNSICLFGVYRNPNGERDMHSVYRCENSAAIRPCKLQQILFVTDKDTAETIKKKIGKGFLQVNLGCSFSIAF